MKWLHIWLLIAINIRWEIAIYISCSSQNSKVHHITWLLSLLDMGLVPISEVETYGQLFAKPEQLLA